MCNWSELHPDILEFISSKLSSFVHLLSMKGVCSSWRRVISEIRNPKTPGESLVFFGMSKNDMVGGSKSIKVDYNVYVLSFDEQNKKSRLLKKTLEHGCLPNTQRTIGSHPDGWLIILKNGKDICIFNFITEVSIPVPNVIISGPDLRVDVVSCYKVITAFLSHSPSRHQDFVMVMTLDFPFHTTSQSTRRRSEVYFWRPGDSTLTRLVIGEPTWVHSYIAFHNYTLYTLNVASPVIETWDFSQRLPKKTMAFPLSCVSDNYMVETLVLSRSGEIFVTVRDVYIGGSFGILKLDLSQKICIIENEWNSLNGWVLIYAYPNLMLSSIDAERHGYRPNSIYFANKIEEMGLIMYSFQDKQNLELWRQNVLDTSCYPKYQSSSACWMDLSTVVCS